MYSKQMNLQIMKNLVGCIVQRATAKLLRDQENQPVGEWDKVVYTDG